jgi:hypothetical protein
MSRVVHYKLRPAELLDLIDGLAAADASNILDRCPGGRLIRSGYLCNHCGEDPSAVYNEQGERAEYPRVKGRKYHRKCGASAAKIIATEDLTRFIPTLVEG